MENSFHGVIAFALIAGLSIIGALIRKFFPLLRNSLIPASIIGGIIGFTLLSFNLIPQFKPSDFTTLTFHFFTLSFMSLCLTGNGKTPSSSGNVIRGGLWLTLIWSISLGVQAVLGYGVIYFYNYVSGSSINELLGAIITHGFTQGPGQALTIGTIWQQEYSIANAAQIGMIYASLGFIVTFIVGVPWARYVIKKGFNENKSSLINDSFLYGFYKKQDKKPINGQMITHSANIDSLAWHLGVLAIAYIITHIWLVIMGRILNDVSPWGINLGVLFSHNMFFVHGLGVCVLMRMLIDRFNLSHYLDDNTLKRITGSSVDFMVVGTLMSISFSILYALLIPILLVTVSITVVTFLGCWWVGRLSGRLGYERSLTSFGCCCGSTGTGLLLLRMLDADFSTPVAKELAFFNLAIVLVNIHLLFIFSPIAPALGGVQYLLIFGGTAFVFIFFIPLLKYWSQRVN